MTNWHLSWRADPRALPLADRHYNRQKDFRVPKSALGKGWGCVVCAIPGNGAIAVLCEPCAAADAPVVDVCAGYPTEAGRAEAEAEPLRAFPWSHIRAFHREDGDA